MQSPTSSISPNTERTKYCAIFTPLGKICPTEFPMSSDWDEDDKEEERKDQNEGEGQTDSEGKTQKTSPRFLSATTFTPQPPNPPSNSSARGPV